MAAVNTFRSQLWENWEDVVAHDGGTTQTISTDIPYEGGTAEVYVDATLVLNTSVGVPNFTLAYTKVNSKLVVTVANVAVAGNSAHWELYIRSAHTYIR